LYLLVVEELILNLTAEELGVLGDSEVGDIDELSS